MLPFGYARVRDIPAAVSLLQSAHAMPVAGGTDVLQLLQEGVIAPADLIDLTALPMAGITKEGDGLCIGALTKLADIADDERIRTRYPALARSLLETASPQVRNMATAGGNLLQRTRCLYFRDAAIGCNKREPGSGCPARDGHNRMNAILGGSEHCIAAYPGDMANALLVLDAELQIAGPQEERKITVEALHREPGDTPHIETNLRQGEIITAIVLPASPRAANSHFVKLRDRASFEWALVSAAVAIETIAGERVRSARIAVGGVGTRPWRLPEVERQLIGRRLDEATLTSVADAAALDTDPQPGNAFKVTLLRRAVERALLIAGGMA